MTHCWAASSWWPCPLMSRSCPGICVLWGQVGGPETVLWWLAWVLCHCSGYGWQNATPYHHYYPNRITTTANTAVQARGTRFPALGPVAATQHRLWARHAGVPGRGCGGLGVCRVDGEQG